jgi:epoxyqueuosine reductase QueG
MPVAVAVQQHNSGHVADTFTAGLCGIGCFGKHSLLELYKDPAH